MSKFGQRVKHLVGEMIPPALFFFLAFQLLALTQALMLRQYDIDATIFVAGLLGALVVAKVVVLAEMLPFINRFPERPLIWNIAWKTMTTIPLSFGIGNVIVRKGLPPINLFVTGGWMAYRQFAPVAPQTTIRFGMTIACPDFRPWK